jgi:hypothetical protein
LPNISESLEAKYGHAVGERHIYIMN